MPNPRSRWDHRLLFQKHRASIQIHRDRRVIYLRNELRCLAKCCQPRCAIDRGHVLYTDDESMLRRKISDPPEESHRIFSRVVSLRRRAKDNALNTGACKGSKPIREQ